MLHRLNGCSRAEVLKFERIVRLSFNNTPTYSVKLIDKLLNHSWKRWKGRYSIAHIVNKFQCTVR
jgi:hypothetical protein